VAVTSGLANVRYQRRSVRQSAPKAEMRSALGPPCAMLCSIFSGVVLARRPGFGYLLDPPFFDLTKDRKMAGTRSGLVIMTALLLSGSVALAQQTTNPCASDIKTLCAGIQPGEGRIKGCIKSHLTDLSPTCEDRVLTVAVTGKLCKTDVAKLCAGIVPGAGGIRACIKSHMPEVSDSCKNAMSQTAAGKKILGRGDL
jgi:hypothetical protein